MSAFLGVFAPVTDAAAQCCPNHTLAMSCANSNLTKSRWCIANDAPNGFGTATLPTAFCSYGERVVTTLEQVFNIQAPGVFEFDLMTCESNGQSGCAAGQSTGGAQTPTDCGTFGNSVTYDAFTGNAYGATGFWGYLLSLHEAINQWTGLASGGWPTDWWADHQSAFPNLMDFHIMNLIGTTNSDNNLLTAAAAQKMRFYPGGDSADAKVVALDNVYGMMPNMDGLAGFSHVFSMVSGDKMSWGNLGSNPNQKLSEYVLAYMGLAVGQNGGQVLKTVQGPSANSGGNICNGTSDGQGDPTYVCSESDIDAIATAHCAIAANGNPSADVSSFQSGNYASVAMGPCGSTCPAECGCDMSTMNCVAPWLAMNGGGSSGSSSGASSGGSSGSSTSGGSTSGGSSGSTSSTSSGSGTSSTSGGSTGSGSTSSGGSSSGSTSSGGSSGSTSSGSTSGGSTGSGGASSSSTGSSSSGATTSGGSSGSGDTGGGFASPSSGCTCHALGERGGHGADSRGPGLWAALALAGLAVVRGRARKR